MMMTMIEQPPGCKVDFRIRRPSDPLDSNYVFTEEGAPRYKCEYCPYLQDAWLRLWPAAPLPQTDRMMYQYPPETSYAIGGVRVMQLAFWSVEDALDAEVQECV